MTNSITADTLIRQLAETHGNQLIKFFVARLRDVAEAQDLAQETYLRLLRVNRPDLIRRPEAYLFTIAVNLIREQALKKSTRPHHVALDDASTKELPLDPLTLETAGPEEALHDEHRVRALERTLQRLSPRARAALIWHRRDGKTYDEIGERLGVSRNMVKKYLARAVAECRKARDEGQGELS